MSRGSKKTAVWYNGRRYVWDDLRAEFVRWIRNRFGRPVCKSYRDDLARLTSNEAAQFVGNAVESDSKSHSSKSLPPSRHLNFLWRERKNGAPRKTKPYTGLWEYPVVGDTKFRPVGTIRKTIEYAQTAFGEDRKVDARSFYMMTDVIIANAVNGELWQSQERFRTFGRIKFIKPLDKNHIEYKNDKVWGSYTPEEETLYIRTHYPNFPQKPLTVADWHEYICGGEASSTDWRHTFRHEIGHAIHYYVMTKYPNSYKAKKERITQFLIKVINDKQFRKIKNLSLFVALKREELIAESIAHVLGNGQNPIANEIVNILLEGVE